MGFKIDYDISRTPTSGRKEIWLQFMGTPMSLPDCELINHKNPMHSKLSEVTILITSCKPRYKYYHSKYKTSVKPGINKNILKNPKHTRRAQMTKTNRDITNKKEGRYEKSIECFLLGKIRTNVT